jgi:predicted nucleic acid-binding protein
MSAAKLLRAFFDTNIFIYADDDRDPEKQKIARQLLEQYFSAGAGVISIQVLQEYANAAIRKLSIDPALVSRKVELLTSYVDSLTLPEDVPQAIAIHRLHGFSFWDSMLIHSARKSSCRIFFSEDTQHGRQIDSLRIINPFL